jgi:hypothetical protein
MSYAPPAPSIFTRANAVCRARNERFRELAEPSTPDDLIRVLESALAIDAEELEELRGLTPPRADDPQLEEIFELTEERLELGREALDAMKAGDEPDDDVIRRENELQFEIEAKMGDYGFAGGGDEDECTEAP